MVTVTAPNTPAATYLRLLRRAIQGSQGEFRRVRPSRLNHSSTASRLALVRLSTEHRHECRPRWGEEGRVEILKLGVHDGFFAVPVSQSQCAEHIVHGHVGHGLARLGGAAANVRKQGYLVAAVWCKQRMTRLDVCTNSPYQHYRSVSGHHGLHGYLGGFVFGSYLVRLR